MTDPNQTTRYFPFDRQRLKIVLFAIISIAIFTISLLFFVLSVNKPYMGTTLILKDGQWKVESIDINGLAKSAGIEVGDTPTEINGQPGPVFLEKYHAVGEVFGLVIKDITVVDNQGQIKQASLENSNPSVPSLIEVNAWFIISFICWMTGFYVFYRKPQNITARLLCICSLTFGLALSAEMAAEREIQFALPIVVIASVTAPWLLLHFFIILPEERSHLQTNKLLYLLYIIPLATVILFPVVGYADGQPLPFFRSFRLLEYGVAFVAAGGVATLNYFQARSPRTRQQMKMVLIACLASIIPFMILSIVPEAIWGRIIVPTGLSVLFLVFIPIGMGVAVLTNRLLDIDVVIRRGVVYGLITLVIATILSAAIFLVIGFQKTINIPEQILISLLLGALATALFGPTKNGVEKLVDKVLYKDRYDYRQIIQSFSTSLESLREFTDISRLIVGTPVKTLNLSGGCLFIKTQSGPFSISTAQGTFSDFGKQNQLADLVARRGIDIEFPNSASSADPDVAFLIPLIAQEKEVGVLCLSQKVSRQKFSPDDIFLLQGLSTVSAVVLQSAMLSRDVSLRDTFVSIASHELRTPLTSIIGYSELLLYRDPPDITRKQWLKVVIENGHKIASIVDDLLNVSRIQSGKINLKLEIIKADDIINDVLAIIKESSPKHEFMVDIEPNLPSIFVDRDKLGQVIDNLLSNAIKYSPGGGHITLSAYHEMPRHRVVLKVADEGIGIAPEDKSLLFTTFHRIQRPETLGIRGSGLGLYIVKEWSEAMGGEVWLESVLNKGSTFYVAFPVSEANDTKQ
jgi:signal transduction histidine kinase